MFSDASHLAKGLDPSDVFDHLLRSVVISRLMCRVFVWIYSQRMDIDMHRVTY